LNFSSASQTYTSLVGKAASCGSLLLVKPFEPTQSYLVNKLTGIGMCGGSRMPGGINPNMSNSQIDIVRAWIGRGALND
jgi:hypothetical protein